MTAANSPEPADLMIVGGTVVDPGAGRHEKCDVAVRGDRIAAVGPDLPRDQRTRLIDATGLLVTPGLVDAHVHIYEGVSHYGINADRHCLQHGSTTVVDAGSAGADTLAGLLRYVIAHSDTRILARVNISTMGMLSRRIGELDSLKWADIDRTVRALADHPQVTLGVKVRLTREELVGREAGLEPLHLARQAADLAGAPLMVHPQNSWAESLDEVLPVLSAGDILTHTYHGLRHSILDENDRLRDSVTAARDRGVHFDLGHGEASFSWRVAETAMAQGFLPTMVSTDLHYYNVNGPVYDLPTVMSKMLTLGCTLDDVVARSTHLPASVIGHPDVTGTLTHGSVADIALLRLTEGPVVFADSYGEQRTGDRHLSCAGVIRGGSVVHTNGVRP